MFKCRSKIEKCRSKLKVRYLKAAVKADTALTTKETWGSCWNLNSISALGTESHDIKGVSANGLRTHPYISSLYSSINSCSFKSGVCKKKLTFNFKDAFAVSKMYLLPVEWRWKSFWIHSVLACGAQQNILHGKLSSIQTVFSDQGLEIQLAREGLKEDQHVSSVLQWPLPLQLLRWEPQGDGFQEVFEEKTQLWLEIYTVNKIILQF